jgi:hypothetical protein
MRIARRIRLIDFGMLPSSIALFRFRQQFHRLSQLELVVDGRGNGPDKQAEEQDAQRDVKPNVSFEIFRKSTRRCWSWGLSS